jgi:hypothetical protein
MAASEKLPDSKLSNKEWQISMEINLPDRIANE